MLNTEVKMSQGNESKVLDPEEKFSDQIRSRGMGKELGPLLFMSKVASRDRDPFWVDGSLINID